MFRFITSTVDKVLFAINLVLAMQIPAFIQQYSQRLAGHLSEAKYQLEKYQAIAEQHYQGNILRLVEQYRANSDPGINAAGDVVFQLIDRISTLGSQVGHLNHPDYFHKLYYFFTELDISLFKATLVDYQLSIPLGIPALATGLIVAIVLNILTTFTFSLFTQKRSY